MTTWKAWPVGLAIFLYFAITTAWLPSELLGGPLNTASRTVQDLVTAIVWGFFLILGIWGLRASQRRGWI